MAQDFPGSKSEIAARIFDAGVVGAGGAGFPTHIKVKARADVVIANGCECEPLIQSDRYALSAHLDDVLDGLRIVMMATGAAKGYVAIREGMSDVSRMLSGRVKALKGIETVEVVNNYPAGDEHILVYEVTGRAIPQGGIPPDVGVVVSNVNTLINVRRAIGGEPVTERIVSVCGDVPRPCLVTVPVGTTVGDLLGLTGNAGELEDKGILLSGVMMGEYCDDMNRPIDKRNGSVIVLPRDNQVIVRKSLPVKTIVKRAASVCCQCTLCTEMCPRHLMGHAIAPHKIMRAVSWSTAFTQDLAGAMFCSGCGLCGVYVCPMLLSPDRISFMVRSEMAGQGITFERAETTRVEPVRPGRLVPHSRIVERTGLAPYEKELEYAGGLKPDRVSIPLSQHVGVPARPTVSVGDSVKRGQPIATVEQDSVGARVHASIGGVVVEIDNRIVIERR